MNRSDENSRTLREYLRVLREQRALIFATAAVAALAALAYSAIKEPEYEALATIEYADAREDLEIFGTIVAPSAAPEKIAAANARIVTRDDVLQLVQEEVGQGTTVDELRDSVSTTVQPDSNLIAITATADDADLAAAIANATAEQARVVAREVARKDFASSAEELRQRIRTSDNETTKAALEGTLPRLITLASVADPVTVTQPAEVPSSPSSPKPIRDTIVAIFLGLMLGTFLAFLRSSLDRRLVDAHEVQHELGLPLVGYVRSDMLGLVSNSTNGRAQVSEDDLDAFRILRANVDFLGKDHRLSSIVVTSALPEEGKTTVAAWYAYANAVAGRRTLLIECDFRRPTLASRFGLSPAPGLSDFFAGEATPKDVLQPVPVEGPQAVDSLPVITAGESTFQPAEMIGSDRFSSFFDQVTRAYEIVVVDSAPLLPVGDTLDLLPQVDGCLFCVRLGQTTRDQAIAAKQAMEHLADKPTGLVVTGVRPGADDDYYGYYSYRAPLPTEAATRAAG